MGKCILRIVVLVFVSISLAGSSGVLCAVAATPKKKADSSIALKGKTYSTMNGEKKITIISSDELEIRANGHNLICKYTVQDNVIRAVITALGASEAEYYQMTPTGLKSEKGVIYYTPDALLAAQKEAASAKARTESIVALSTKATTTLVDMPAIAVPKKPLSEVRAIISDVDVKVGERSYWFGKIAILYYLPKGDWYSTKVDLFPVKIRSANGGHLCAYPGIESAYFKDEATRDKFLSELDTAIKAWRAKFASVAEAKEYRGVEKF